MCAWIIALGFFFKWFFTNLSLKTIVCFMKEKNYTPPTRSELKACSRKAVEKMFTFGNKH